jgi:D-alanyl-D-alanine carboxypeptidase
METTSLQKLVDRAAARSGAGDITVLIEPLDHEDTVRRWSASSTPGLMGRSTSDSTPIPPFTTRSLPGFGPHDPYFIASSTKLYIATLVLQLHEAGIIHLDDRLVDTTNVNLTRLHTRPSDVAKMTIRHALSHTTGLPNYLEDRRRFGGPSLLQDVLANGDRTWGINEVIKRTRQLGPRFAPGAPNKAHYSDTNYQLLGHLIEHVTQQRLAQVLHERIVSPLGLRHTFLFDQAQHRIENVQPFMIEGAPASLPGLMTSVGADGGMVSCAADGVKFLRALTSGVLVRPSTWQLATNQWNRIFFPFQYGLGVMKFALPRALTGFQDLTMIGHGGATGSLLFVAPQHNAIIVGTINRLEPRRLAYQLGASALRSWVVGSRSYTRTGEESDRRASLQAS